MRVTCVIGSLSGGGAEKNIIWLTGELAQNDHTVTILTFRSDVPDFYDVPKGVIRRYMPPTAAKDCRWFDWRCLRERAASIRNELLETRPNVVISFIDITNTSVLMALSRTDIPVIVSERVDPRYYDLGIRWGLLRRIYYPRAAKVVVQTHAVSEWARTMWPPWSVATIPNAVSRGDPESAVMCKRPQWFNAKNIVSAGRLVRQKGFDLLINAFASLAQDFPDWDLTVVGDGPLKSYLKQLANSRGISNRVHFPGTVQKLPELFARTEIFVLSSRYEGFPNTLCEAMACGAAVISFDCPSGPAEIVRDNVDGLLVPPEDVNQLRNAMRRLMTSAQERKRLAERATEVTERFGARQVLAKWQVVMSEVRGPKTIETPV